MDARTLPPERLAGLPPAVVEFTPAILDENAARKARVADLEARLNRNSTNSSRPPSSDPPAVKRAPPKPKSGKKPGGPPGHPEHERALAGMPDIVRECKPAACRRCARPLAGRGPAPGRPRPGPAATPGDRAAAGRPGRHRVPPAPPALPGPWGDDLRRPAGRGGRAGRAAAAGRLRPADRGLPAEQGQGRPAARRPVRGAPVGGRGVRDRGGRRRAVAAGGRRPPGRRPPANVDEAGMGTGQWLWAMVTAVATVFRIAAGRARDEFTRLVGPDQRRVVTSDRHAPYMHPPGDRHQRCWAHTIRTQSHTGGLRHLVRHIRSVLTAAVARWDRGDRLRLQVA